MNFSFFIIKKSWWEKEKSRKQCLKLRLSWKKNWISPRKKKASSFFKRNHSLRTRKSFNFTKLILLSFDHKKKKVETDFPSSYYSRPFRLLNSRLLYAPWNNFSSQKMRLFKWNCMKMKVFPINLCQSSSDRQLMNLFTSKIASLKYEQSYEKVLIVDSSFFVFTYICLWWHDTQNTNGIFLFQRQVVSIRDECLRSPDVRACLNHCLLIPFSSARSNEKGRRRNLVVADVVVAVGSGENCKMGNVFTRKEKGNKPLKLEWLFYANFGCTSETKVLNMCYMTFWEICPLKLQQHHKKFVFLSHHCWRLFQVI